MDPNFYTEFLSANQLDNTTQDTTQVHDSGPNSISSGISPYDTLFSLYEFDWNPFMILDQTMTTLDQQISSLDSHMLYHYGQALLASHPMPQSHFPNYLFTPNTHTVQPHTSFPGSDSYNNQAFLATNPTPQYHIPNYVQPSHPLPLSTNSNPSPSSSPNSNTYSPSPQPSSQTPNPSPLSPSPNSSPSNPTKKPKPNPCPHCPLSFTRPSDRYRHITTIHLQVRYHCVVPGCRDNGGKGYCRGEKLRQHLRGRHGIKEVVKGTRRRYAGERR